MFTGRTGQPIRPDNLTDRFNQLAEAATVRPIGPHQVRHLIASTLLDAGYGVHEVAERLGHDPATLMRYYTRVNAARRLQATDRIAELMTASEVQPRSLRNWGGCTMSLVPGVGKSVEMRTARRPVSPECTRTAGGTASPRVELAGGDTGDLMMLLGWSSEEMARRYGASAAGERSQQTHARLGIGERV